MQPIRMRARAETDGELLLRGLPIRKGDEAEVIILTGETSEESADEVVLAILENDPSWEWLSDPEEDV